MLQPPNVNNAQVARKLVLMEQDLERSEEKVELSERFVMLINAYVFVFVCSRSINKLSFLE